LREELSEEQTKKSKEANPEAAEQQSSNGVEKESALALHTTYIPYHPTSKKHQ
jgi:hypothetical protein